MDVTRCGGGVGIPGLYVTADPGAVDEAAKVGSLSIAMGVGWAKSLYVSCGVHGVRPRRGEEGGCVVRCALHVMCVVGCVTCATR